MTADKLVERRWIGHSNMLAGLSKVTNLEHLSNTWRDEGHTVTEWVPASALEVSEAKNAALAAENATLREMVERAAEDERARGFERDQLYAHFDDAMPDTWKAAARKYLRDLGAMHPSERTALRQEADRG